MTSTQTASSTRDVITAEIWAIHASMSVGRLARYYGGHHEILADLRASLAVAVAALADMAEEDGDTALAGQIRRTEGRRVCQETAEGAEVVTVGRYGSRTAGTGRGHSVALWTTKVYRAVRRQSDGLLTWRLVSELGGHSTAGRGVSGPMIARAEAEAESRGLPFALRVTHGSICE